MEYDFKIVSGGQTGVDRAALDAAIKLEIPHGGWCPKGRLAEDGTLDDVYNLVETDTADYNERTRLNIRDSDGTLIIIPSKATITDGTILTIEEVKAKEKVYLIIDLDELKDKKEAILDWIDTHHIKILNVAGPRESQYPGIYVQCIEAFSNILAEYPKKNSHALTL